MALSAHQASECDVLAGLAIHVAQHRLDHWRLPVNQGRAQLMTGAALLLGASATVEDQDVLRLLALLLDKLLRTNSDSQQAKLDGLTPTAMEQRVLAIKSYRVADLARGSWRHPLQGQLSDGSWSAALEAALCYLWHREELGSEEGEIPLLQGQDPRVQQIHGLLVAAFYQAAMPECTIDERRRLS